MIVARRTAAALLCAIMLGACTLRTELREEALTDTFPGGSRRQPCGQ